MFMGISIATKLKIRKMKKKLYGYRGKKSLKKEAKYII
jgi:hypothetical protein